MIKLALHFSRESRLQSEILQNVFRVFLKFKPAYEPTLKLKKLSEHQKQKKVLQEAQL